MVKISAVVMASGMSERMKTDKLHLLINEKYLYEHILETIRQYPFFEVITAAKDDDILAKANSLGFRAVRNEKYFVGRSESIKAALMVSRPTDGFMFFVADQPFVSMNTIDKLCREFSKNPSHIIVPYYNGTKGNPVIFPSDFKAQLMKLEGDQGGKNIIQSNLDKMIRVDISSDLENIDIDTPEDYERVKNIILYHLIK